MHKCWNEILFQDSEETIDSAEKNDNSYESLADFQWEAKKKRKTQKPSSKNKNSHFSAPTTVRLSNKRPFHS